MTFLGQELIVEKGGKINGEIVSAGQSIDVMGSVGRGISGALQNLSITGIINGKVDVEAQQVTLSDNAVVNGDFSYRAPQKAEISDKATISGVVNYKQIKPQQKVESRDFAKAFGIAFVVGKLISLVSFTLMALLFAWLFPKFMLDLITRLRQEKISLFGWGLIVLILTPILAVFLLFTIIGVPIAFLLGLVWIIAVLLSKMIVGVWVGYEVLSYNKKKAKKPTLLLSSIVGVPI